MNSSTTAEGIAVRVRALHKSFNGKAVLKGLDLEVEPGEIIVIMGPSGSGKSVLLKHIIGLETPDSGEILLHDESIDSPGVRDRFRLAMVFQSGALLNSLTVAENVGLYLTEHRLKPENEIRQIVSDKLELVGLEGIEEQYPNEISGGMKKRVAIARALVIEPQLILFDEPTSELDPLIAVTIAEEILAVNKRLGATTIAVSHDRDLAFGIAHRIAIIHEGKIIAAGPPREVRNNPHPVVQRFLTADIKQKSPPS